MLNILMEYEDCDITHTVPGILNLFYSKASQTFEITIFSTGEVVDCCNRDEACEISHKLLPCSKTRFKIKTSLWIKLVSYNK